MRDVGASPAATPIGATDLLTDFRALNGEAPTSLTQIIFLRGGRPTCPERVRAMDVAFREKLDKLHVREYCILRTLVQVG